MTPPTTCLPSAWSPAIIHRNASEADVLERYEILDVIGVGGFSEVKRALDRRTRETVAVKVVEKARYAAGDNSLQREIQVLTKVIHPCCVRLHAVFYCRAEVYLITEYVPGGELLDRITEYRRYEERDAAVILGQILTGIAYLHSIGIVHRDLKLENLLMTSSKGLGVKIVDFGLSKHLSVGALSTMCGSPQYVAPEILSMNEDSKGYSCAVDLWSVGVILFILLAGYSPFDDESDALLFRKIRAGDFDADDPVWDAISPGAKDLVARLLVVDPAQRLTAEDALCHPWLVQMVGEAQEADWQCVSSSTRSSQDSTATRSEVLLRIEAAAPPEPPTPARPLATCSWGRLIRADDVA